MVNARSLAASLLVPAVSMAAALPVEEGTVGINIVGGTTATIGEFPYIVALTDGSTFCGGVLISANTVLTAGHCAGMSQSSLRVRAGSANRSSGGTQVSVSSITIHPSYREGSDGIPYNDVAVFRLATSIAESSTIKYATLPAQGSDPATGSSVTVAGWGLTSENGSGVVSALRKVTVSVISRATCRSQYGTSSITDAMWCASVPGGGKDACGGDSGGPIIDASTGVLQGVVSWGNGCARANYAGVYTRIGNFIDWINANKA
ncbi:unnamed protein product [Clonostachys byssicola]|uniref:Peptidase S1 domain-containing protein n=1 Tax=Clonostachys byssicola TaxID=160290 RepID=A0A9N9UH61_9HYPO|nr:unnamed protein product [Clonostachys byssicola]